MAARAKRGKTREAPSTGGRRKVFDQRRRSCHFCKGKIVEIDYKDIAQIRRHVSERGKIKGRGNTGTCRRHQTQLAVAIKRAREMALLPYVGDAPEPTRSRSRPGG